jgi:ABC-2 type transport system ATP-binding protein
MDLALEATGVSKAYGDRAALCGVDLAVRRGELHGLLGPNGAGKTTLMRVLLGLVRRDGGRVHVLGRPLGLAPRELPHRVAGLVETPAFYPYLSGRKNLALLARLDATPSGPATAVDDALEQAGLAAEANIAVAAYSAGMRQRLGVAAALLRSPRLLFLDEPTSALDPRGARDVRALARHLATRGAAVVWSSHDMAEVEDLCTVLTIMNRGRIVCSGTIDALRSFAPAAVYALRTSDDAAAFALASRWPCLRLGPAANGSLQISADRDALDAFTIALGRAGIAVRALECRTRSLESLFLDLTATAGTAAPVQVPHGALDVREPQAVS